MPLNFKSALLVLLVIHSIFLSFSSAKSSVVKLIEAQEIAKIDVDAQIIDHNHEKIIYYIPSFGAIWLLDLSTKSKRFVAGNIVHPKYVKFSPDGLHIMYVTGKKSSQQIRVVRVSDRRVVMTTKPHSGFGFDHWKSNCQFAVGTREDKPTRIYLYQLKNCKVSGAPGINYLFQDLEHGNWFLIDGKKLLASTLNFNFHSIVSRKDKLFGITQAGQLFVLDNSKISKPTLGPYGVRHSVSNSGDEVLYIMPDGAANIWKWNRDEILKLPKITRPYIINNQTVVYRLGKRLIKAKLVNQK